MESSIRWLLLMLVIFSTSSATAELYKYKNEQGITVMSQTVPPEVAKNGYIVLSDDGIHVLEVVPRALTREETAEAILIEEAIRAAEERERKAREADKVLLRLYAGPADVIYARDIRLREVDKRISSALERKKKFQGNRQELLTIAAQMERTGESVSQSHIDQLANIETKIEKMEDEIAGLSKEKTETVIKFKEVYDRVFVLYGLNKTPNVSDASN